MQFGQLHLRPSDFDPLSGRGGEPENELLAEIKSTPAAEREIKRKEMMRM